MITPIGHADARRSFVRGTVVRSALTITLTAFGAGIALLMFGDHADLVIKAAFAVGGFLVAMTVLTNVTAYVYGEADGASGRRRRSEKVEPWPGELLEIESRVSMARVSQFDYQSRLRPLLHELATRRLESNRGVDIERQAGEARTVLGAELWEQLQPMELLRNLRDQPGPTTAGITRMVDKIESI